MSSTLDIERPTDLMNYLREHHHVRPYERPRVTTLSGGVSNRIVLVERENGEAWVLKQALAKLRVQADWFSSPERIHREALGLLWLNKLMPAATIPLLVFEDYEHHLLAMEAVPQPHQNWKTMLLAGHVQQSHVEQFGRLLGTIHRQARCRQNELKPLFADTTFFESLRLEPYYEYTAKQVPQAGVFLRMLIDETRMQQITLVHGDFSPKNILVRDNRLVLLDYEVIHWGDPAFDLGFSLSHLLSKAHHLRAHRTTFVEAARCYWQSYDDSSSESRVIRHTLGCLLARVAGRSPLEYLTPSERNQQQVTVLRLMAAPPGAIFELIARFIACL